MASLKRNIGIIAISLCVPFVVLASQKQPQSQPETTMTAPEKPKIKRRPQGVPVFLGSVLPSAHRPTTSGSAESTTSSQDSESVF